MSHARLLSLAAASYAQRARRAHAARMPRASREHAARRSRREQLRDKGEIRAIRSRQVFDCFSCLLSSRSAAAADSTVRCTPWQSSACSTRRGVLEIRNSRSYRNARHDKCLAFCAAPFVSLSVPHSLSRLLGMQLVLRPDMLHTRRASRCNSQQSKCRQVQQAAAGYSGPLQPDQRKDTQVSPLQRPLETA